MEAEAEAGREGSCEYRAPGLRRLPVYRAVYAYVSTVTSSLRSSVADGAEGGACRPRKPGIAPQSESLCFVSERFFNGNSG